MAATLMKFFRSGELVCLFVCLTGARMSNWRLWSVSVRESLNENPIQRATA